MTEVEVRRATGADLPRLSAFFAAAYGERSVFRDAAFVRWFLGGGGDTLLAMIAVAPSGDIVGHYGAVRSDVLLDGRPASMLWGVSAFTLPAYRGGGLGSRLAGPWLTEADVFGVIGFSADTATFYERSGFHLFGRRRFVRQVLNLRDRTFEVVAELDSDVARARRLLPITPAGAVSRAAARAIVRDPNALGDLDLDAPAGIAVTTLRSPSYLRWRYVDQHWLTYDISAIVERGRTRAYVASRRTLLEPREDYALRIVDAFGEPAALADLVAAIVTEARARGDLWIDFVASRALPALDASGFVRLTEDDAALLPSVSAPIQRRANHEYLGLYSTVHRQRLAELDLDGVYFTRMDSDRDRAARVPPGTVTP